MTTSNLFLMIAILAAVVLTLLMCVQESRKRKIHFAVALLLCILLTPLLGYFIISNQPLRNQQPCNWCGNTQKETIYCGICGKNEAGEIRP